MTVKTETFTGNNGDGLNGTYWATQGGVLSPDIQSNAASGSNANYCAAYWAESGVTFEDDQYAQVVAAVADIAPGATVRYQTGNGKGYNGWGLTWGTGFYCYLGPNQAMGSTITLAQALVVGDVVRVEVKGTTIEYFVNGSSVGTRTDSTNASGKPGFFMYVMSTDVGSVDDWEGGDWAPVGPPGAVLGYLLRQQMSQ